MSLAGEPGASVERPGEGVSEPPQHAGGVEEISRLHARLQ